MKTITHTVVEYEFSFCLSDWPGINLNLEIALW